MIFRLRARQIPALNAPMSTETEHAMESCGAELAEAAVVPEQLAALMQHVAENLDAHAVWVGTATAEAEQEHDRLLKLADDYRSIAAAALRAVATMRDMRSLEPAPHDPARWDREAFARWMRKKIDLQRAFAHLLLEHAEDSERVLAQQ
jgi:hypothetical protein